MAAWCLLALTFPVLRASSPVFVLDNQLLASPAEVGALSSQLTTAGEGEVYASWIEQESGSETKVFRVARFDGRQHHWGHSQIVARGKSLVASGSNTPQIAAGGGRGEDITALWYLENESEPTASSRRGDGYAVWAVSHDDGQTWSVPVPLSRESQRNEFAAVQSLSDGRVLAAWLDARAKHAGGDAQELYARILGAEGPDQCVDQRVCDCCATTLTAFPDGSALLAYRGRSEDEIRDIHVSRFRGGSWEAPRLVNPDRWKIAGCPVNGPQLTSVAGKVAVAWFSAANDQSRVLVSTSTSAGDQFLLPLRIDDHAPIGHVGTVMLHDGTVLVAWVEQAQEKGGGELWLRRVSPNGELTVPVLLATVPSAQALGVPRIALIKDYDDKPAEVLVSYTLSSDATTQLATRLLVLPRPNNSSDPGKPCDCPTNDDPRGTPIKGRIVSADTKGLIVSLQHGEVPGMLAAETTTVHVDADDLKSLHPNAEVLGKIERRQDGWWLFDVRVLVPTEAMKP